MKKFRLFTLPHVKENDSERLSQLLYCVCWYTIISFFTLSLINAFLVPENLIRTFISFLFLTFFCSISLGLLYVKKPKAAGYFYIIQFWTLVTALIISGGGITAQANNSYLIIVMAAGLFLGWKTGFATAIVCIFAELVITILGEWGMLPRSALNISKIQYFMVNCFHLCMLIIFVYYYTRSIESLFHTYRLELAEKKKIEMENKNNIYTLGERVKELTAVHKLSILLREEKNIKSIIQKLVLIIPPAFQYPEFTQAIVRLGNTEAKTNGFFHSKNSLRTDFLTQDSKIGHIEVVYTDGKLTFLEEEKDLIITMASMLKTEYDRLLMEEQVAKSANRLKALFSAMRDIVVVLDKKGGYLEFAPTDPEYKANLPEDSLGKNIKEVLPKEIANLIQKNINKSLIIRKPVHIEYSMNIDKKHVSFYSTVTPFTEDSVILIQRDITEKKELEEQMRRSQRLDSLGTLASGIAHDLNNVLASIVLSIDMLRIKVQDNKLLSMIDLQKKSAMRGKEIVKQVLTFARGAKQHFAPQNLKLLLQEIAMFIEQTFPKKILLKVNMPVVPIYIMGDSTQLHQVLLNLCVNARDAMPEGGTLTLEIENIYINQFENIVNGGIREGRYVVIKVSDTGEGIPLEIRDKLFDPFFTTKDIGKGTGLGLSTAYSIIKEHKGFISFESILHKGTEFKVYLPVLLNEATLENKEKMEDELTLPSGNGELILIIEDELSILNITKETLVSFGYSVLFALDGIEALKIVSENRGQIKLILTDLDMPKVNGIETIKSIREIEKEIKVIISSGSLENFESSKFSELSVQAYLRKPYTSAKLLQTMHAVLES